MNGYHQEKGTLFYPGEPSKDRIPVYEGQWFAGKYHGEGIMFLENNQKYEGNFEYGIPSGKGILYM